MVSWLVGGVSLLLSYGVALTASTSCEGFTRKPDSAVAPEGTSVVFFCRHPEARVIQWSVNGTPVQDLNSPNVTQGSVTYPNGTEVITLTIGALREYSGTLVQCQAFLPDRLCYINSTLLVKDPPGPVTNLCLHSTTREMVLTWDLPNLTDSYSVCIDVYQDSNLEPEQVGGKCCGNMSIYTFSVSDPDPEVPYQFVVTIRYDVRGAKNGTRSNATGYFIGEPKAVPGESIECRVIAVSPYPSMQLLVHNAEAWITTGRKVDNYSIEVVVCDNEALHCITQPTMCPVSPDSVRIENSTISLSIDCPNLPVERFGNGSLIATNGAGRVNVPLKYLISIHFIQDISAQPCNSAQLCQLRVSLTYVVGAKGAFMVVHEGQSDIQYFVGSRSAAAVLVNGLKGGNYSLAVFTLGGNGLPSEFPANLPMMVSNIPPTVYQDLRMEHLKNVNLQADGACFTCHFYARSPATHCAVVLHTLPQSPAEQIRTKSYKFRRDGDEARRCIDTKPGWYGVVTFGYFNMAVNGRPFRLGIRFLNAEGPKQATHVGQIVAILAVLVILGAVLGVVVCVVCCVKHKRSVGKKGGKETNRFIPETVQKDPSLTSNAILEHIKDRHIQTQWPVLGQQLGFTDDDLHGVTSMEELLAHYCTSDHFDPSWMAIFNAFQRLGEEDLAAEICRDHILKKTCKKSNQSADSGLYTQSASTVENYEDPHIEIAEDDPFKCAAQCVDNGERSNNNSVSDVKDPAKTLERGVHKQETDPGDRLNFFEKVRSTLTSSTLPEGRLPTDHTISRVDGDDDCTGDAGMGDRSTLQFFQNELGN